MICGLPPPKGFAPTTCPWGSSSAKVKYQAKLTNAANPSRAVSKLTTENKIETFPLEVYKQTGKKRSAVTKQLRSSPDDLAAFWPPKQAENPELAFR